MKYCVGIDLGSTTTKAVVLDEGGEVLGRGITNSRSDYGVACEVALVEALINGRFGLVAAELDGAAESGALADAAVRARWLGELERRFRLEQYLGQLATLAESIARELDAGAVSATVRAVVEAILERMRAEAPALYEKNARRRSDFFRDLAGGRFQRIAESLVKDSDACFEDVVGFYDKAILVVENSPAVAGAFLRHTRAALGQMPDAPPALERAVARAGDVKMELAVSVGTGYGRQTLPFPKQQIRSEILCHGLGAHSLFPLTRTVLDIGGQDTKAIQIDGRGIVTSFQMNDRCAAGCGRYLGYIADEMNLGVHELGPLARQATRTVRINSTCTVFAGAELRERLSLGERREDILAGLHRSVVLRAMSLLARSGGIRDQFTFTGGVAKNPAAVEALRGLVEENYGKLALNISPDSIYTGALGAALFAHRDWLQSVN